jgi:hypothetical protein
LRTASPTTVRDGIDAPLLVAERGLKIFPLPAGEKGADLPDWPNKATNDLDAIRNHWPINANIGVPMRANWLVGIDLDQHDNGKDGVAAFSALCEKHDQPWPETFTVRSASGNGLHLYTWCPPDRPISSSGKRLGAPGVDIKGPGKDSLGGYLVGPGSVVNGRAYEIVRDVPIMPLPLWIADILDPPQTDRPRTPIGQLPTCDDRYVLKALTSEVQNILDAAQGGRNDQLNRSAFNLGTLVGAGLLAASAAEEALMSAAESIGLVHDDGDRQTWATIASGLNAGTRRPRHLRAIK